MTRQFIRPAALGVPLLVLAACNESPTAPEAPVSPSAETPALAVAANTWTARTAYPVDVYDHAAASITNPSTLRTTVYVIGGFPRATAGPGSMSDAVRAYDVAAKTWRVRTDFPLRVAGTNGAVEINGKIYVSGGFTRRYDANRDVYRLSPLRSLYVYNPGTNSWARRQDMPVTSAQGVSAAYQGKLYVATSCFEEAICGDASPQGALWRYNPANNNWVLLSRTPHDPSYGGGGFIGGKLYLVNDLGSVDVYDVATNTWSTGPERPRRYCNPAYTTFQAKLYLVGCRDDFDDSGNWPMLVFNPASGWSEAAAPPIAATGHRWTLTRIFTNGKPGLELVGGNRPQNNWQYLP